MQAGLNDREEYAAWSCGRDCKIMKIFGSVERVKSAPKLRTVARTSRQHRMVPTRLESTHRETSVWCGLVLVSTHVQDVWHYIGH